MTPERVIAFVCREFDLSEERLLFRQRNNGQDEESVRVRFARRCAIWLMREACRFSVAPPLTRSARLRFFRFGKAVRPPKWQVIGEALDRDESVVRVNHQRFCVKVQRDKELTKRLNDMLARLEHDERSNRTANGLLREERLDHGAS